MHTHNPFHPYAFDYSRHLSEALPTNLLVRNRAVDYIETAVSSGSHTHIAGILPGHVGAVRAATQMGRHSNTHHVMVVQEHGQHYLKVVTRRSHRHA